MDNSPVPHCKEYPIISKEMEILRIRETARRSSKLTLEKQREIRVEASVDDKEVSGVTVFSCLSELHARTRSSEFP